MCVLYFNLFSNICTNYVFPWPCKCLLLLVWSFCNYELIIMYMMEGMLRCIYQITSWSILSGWHPIYTTETRKRKYMRGVDRVVAKRRNTSKQHLLMTLKRQFISACCYSCSVSMLLFFIWSGMLSHVVRWFDYWDKSFSKWSSYVTKS